MFGTNSPNHLSEKVLVILGSARDSSNTLKTVERLCPWPKYEMIDLRDYGLMYYDYGSTSGTDRFREIVERILESEIIVFATPVYWYSMSGQMKVFFDRLTELITVDKPVGRSLKGKKTYLIASGGNAELPEGFEIPFKLTSKYLDMVYTGASYSQFR